MYIYKLYNQFKPQSKHLPHCITALFLQEFPVKVMGPGNSSHSLLILINIISTLTNNPNIALLLYTDYPAIAFLSSD